MTDLPSPDRTTILFAHPAYGLAGEFAARRHPSPFIEARSLEELEARIGEADVLVVSGLWRNAFAERAPRLRFVQSISAGTDQYDRELFARAGIRLASAQGANETAVAEHAMALILALTRQIHLARDNQAARTWRPMIADRAARESELDGRTLVIVGLGRIGLRLARLAKAFGMRVVGVKRNAEPVEGVDAVVPTLRLRDTLGEADVVALTCPLTPETTGLIGREALAAMRPHALLVNVARGRVVDEAALIAALVDGRIAGAGLDCVQEEPLPAGSPLWTMGNVLVTPHSAGETGRYETNVVDLLVENLDRLARGEPLRNGIV